MLIENLLFPPTLFFALGIIAGFCKSGLEIPNSIGRYLSLYLMMAIGFKGGVAISNMRSLDTSCIYLFALGVLLSFTQPFIAYALLRRTTNLDPATAAATASSYGSVSIVTFAVAIMFLKDRGLEPMPCSIALVAIMEAPAILSGLFLAHKYDPKTAVHQEQERELMKEIFTNGAILLLLGSLAIGWITGDGGMQRVRYFFVDSFEGFLCFFMLDMGLVAAQRLTQMERFSWKLVSFGIYMPLIGAALGTAASKMLGIDLATAMILTTLCSSASYIAVPAAMRLALPEAKPGIYIPLSLGITFTLSVTVGIPLFFEILKLCAFV